MAKNPNVLFISVLTGGDRPGLLHFLSVPPSIGSRPCRQMKTAIFLKRACTQPVPTHHTSTLLAKTAAPSDWIQHTAPSSWIQHPHGHGTATGIRKLRPVQRVIARGFSTTRCSDSSSTAPLV